MRAAPLVALLCLFLFPLVGAVQYSDVVLQDATSNITLNITSVVLSVDSVSLGNGVNLSLITYNVTGANFSIPSLNLTTTNSLVYSYQFPNITSATSAVITFQNGLSYNLSQVTMIASTSGTTPASPVWNSPDGTTRDITTYTYLGGLITFTTDVQAGESSLTLNTTTTPQLSPEAAVACEGSLSDILRSFTQLAAIIVGVLLIVLVYGLVQNGELNEDALKILLGAAASLIIALLSTAVTMSATCT